MCFYVIRGKCQFIVRFAGNRNLITLQSHILLFNTRADFRLETSQWETSLQCNGVSLWLGVNLESAQNSMTVIFDHGILYRLWFGGWHYDNLIGYHGYQLNKATHVFSDTLWNATMFWFECVYFDTRYVSEYDKYCELLIITYHEAKFYMLYQIWVYTGIEISNCSFI